MSVYRDSSERVKELVSAIPLHNGALLGLTDLSLRCSYRVDRHALGGFIESALANGWVIHGLQAFPLTLKPHEMPDHYLVHLAKWSITGDIGFGR